MFIHTCSVQGSTDQNRTGTGVKNGIQHSIDPGPETSNLAGRRSLVQSKDKSFKVNIKNYRAWPTSQESLLIKDCNVRESNPGLPRGRREFYH